MGTWALQLPSFLQSFKASPTSRQVPEAGIKAEDGLLFRKKPQDSPATEPQEPLPALEANTEGSICPGTYQASNPPLHRQGQIHPHPAASCSIFLPTSPFALVRLIQFQMQSNSFWREVRYLYTKVEVSRQNSQMACLF